MKYILIGKCYNSESNGPANVMRNLTDGLKGEDVDVEPVLLSEDCKKGEFLRRTVYLIMHERNAFVNVHTSGFLIPLLVYIMSWLNRRNFYYLTVHGIYRIDSEMKGSVRKFYILTEAFLYRHFPNLICVSEMLREDVRSLFGREKRVYVIPNGTDARSSRSFRQTAMKERTVSIIMLGGLRFGKGIDKTLALTDFLVNIKSMDICLTICGAEEGTRDASWLKGRVQEAGLEGRVEYLGSIMERQKLYDLISESDFHISLSRYDTFNVAIAESLVLGCPCICSHKCGAAYLVRQGESGMVVNPDEDGAFEKIYEYIQSFGVDSAKRRRIWTEREKLAGELSWQRVCRMYLKLWQEAAEKGRM